MNNTQIELAHQIDELTAKERTTIFIDAESGVELTIRVAS